MTTTLPTIINEKELSTLLGRSLSSIRKDRLTGRGPRYIKYANGRVFYDMRDVEEYLAANKRSFTTQIVPVDKSRNANPEKSW